MDLPHLLVCVWTYRYLGLPSGAMGAWLRCLSVLESFRGESSSEKERIMLVMVGKRVTEDKFHNAILFQTPAVPCSNTSLYTEELWAGPTCLLELLLEAFTWLRMKANCNDRKYSYSKGLMDMANGMPEGMSWG